MNNGGSKASGGSTRGAAARAPLLAWPWAIAAVVLLALATAWAWLQEPLPVPPGWQKQEFSFFKPIEVNAHRRLPEITSQLRVVQFAADGLRGWAVGDGGAVIATTNGGKSWAAQSSGTTQTLHALSMAADGLQGWAVGDGGAIIATNDGGKSWAAQSSGTTQGLSSLSMAADGLRGWAVGGGGTVIATTDGGKSWAAQSSSTTQTLLSLSMAADGLRGWAVGAGGTVIATTDGGKSWVAQSSGTTRDLLSLSMAADGLRGWAVGWGGAVIATTDGGKSWAAQSSGTTQALWSLSMAADGLRGWAVGWGGTVIATTDGGKSWAAQSSGTTQPLWSLSMAADGLRAWAVGSGGAVIATTDGGKSWAAQSSGTTRDLWSLSMAADGLRGWAVGSGGTVIATTDGGKSWAAQSSGTTQALSSLSMAADGLRAWAVGSRGTVIATTDGGKSWAAQSSGTTQNLRSLSMAADGLHGWAVGSGGTVIATTDGGKSWAAQSSGTTQTLWSLSMAADGLRAWAVGSGGTVIATTDGGKSWAAQSSGTTQTLWSLSMAADGLRAWAVGGGGAVIATTDGGKSWAAQSSGTTQTLWSLRMAADGLRGWAVGDGGTVIATTDGGKSWAAQSSGTTRDLWSLSMAADGLRGWAVGEGGTILTSTDGGKTWMHAERYTRYPAPWYALAVALSAWLLWLSWRLRPTARPLRSVADMAASDAEVRSPADDRLEFGGLARGISRFLRNTETRPPLTLAITGDWGSGKSSLMQLVCADLRRFGHRPLWFNAWHHQKEEHLFAALLGAVRAQAVPPLLGPSGLLVRLRLLLVRSRKHYLLLMALLFGAVFCAWLSLQAPHVMERYVATTTRIVAPSGSSKAVPASPPAATAASAAAPTQPLLSDTGLDLLQRLGQLMVALAALYALFKASKPFGVDPAVLLASLRENMSLKTATAQNDFRTLFAQQFRELVQVLPYRLVIVIDDLDRCKPSAVLDVMEAVNYLTSAGDCFVIFGMATERVQAALGLAFKDIAAEMANLEGAVKPVPAEGAAANAAFAELVKRRAYAADYLQKLVNIEIKVPQRGDLVAHQLLVAAELVPRNGLREGALALWRLWPLIGAIGAVIAASLVAQYVAHTQAPPPTVVAAAPVPAAVANTPAPSQPTPSQPKEKRVIEEPRGTGPAIIPGDTYGWQSVVLWLTLALLPLLAVGGVMVVLVLRKTIRETRDSNEFNEALAIWTRVVATRRDTPRAIKRFGNRIRYLAMLQQGQAKDETQWDVVRTRLRRMFGARSTANAEDAGTPPQNALAEHQLIAMGAVHEVKGKGWKDALPFYDPHYLKTPSAMPGEEKNEQEGDEPSPNQALGWTIRQAIDEHITTFSVAWPPTEKEQEVFERLLAGVRLAGDAQIITPEQDRTTRHRPPSRKTSSSPPESSQAPQTTE